MISTVASAMIWGVRAVAIAAAPPIRLMVTAVPILVCGHRQFAAIPASANSAAQPGRVSRVIAYFVCV